MLMTYPSQCSELGPQTLTVTSEYGGTLVHRLYRLELSPPLKKHLQRMRNLLERYQLFL